MVGGGGRWWYVMVGCGRWWWVVGGGRWRRSLEAAGGHGGHFPRTDFGLSAGIYSSNNAARTPKALLVGGINV